MWRFLLLLLLIALPAIAQDARPLLGPGTLPPRGPVAAAPSTIPPLAAAPSIVEAEPAPTPLSGEGKAPEQPLPAQAQQAPMPPPSATPAPGLTLAPDPARCGPAREGQVACMSGRLCACRFERGGQLTGRGDHFAWDCGPLRPSCDLPPADLSGGAVQPEILIMPEIGPRRR
ncbi:hypothetical protein [Plastoroseomonas hellenica]|uniref:hypothetical protein n=1 Tax=Plastoroseomonas hellenica TaxID=2687306 RepID=UPI001BA7C377|nr:hypothetical protein [Plastoroseomonas hellenica]MBR0645678.1 hypothetical protein [Plastoroseomonas hellenica]